MPRHRPSRRQPNRTKLRQPKPLESRPSPSSPLETFRRDWTQLFERDAAIDAYRHAWEEGQRKRGAVLSAEYVAQREEYDKVTGDLQRAHLRRLLHAVGVSTSEMSSAIATLMLASIPDPALRSAHFAQQVLLASWELAVLPPLWVQQNISETWEAAKTGQVSLDRAFALTAPKGKSSAVEAGRKRQRDLALVMAIKQCMEQRGFTLKDACKHVARTTDQIKPKTLENLYCRDKQQPEILQQIVQHLMPHYDQEIRDTWKNLGVELCEKMGVPLTLPPSTLHERNCLTCNTPFTTNNSFIRRCPACHRHNS